MNLSVPDKQILENMYIKDKIPMYKIAKKLNMSVGKIYNFIKKYNIPTRSQKEVFTMKGKKYTDEQRKARSERLKGHKVTEESKEKMRGTRIGIGKKKFRKDGYVQIYFPDHPKADCKGFVMEHVLVMECLIGRWLKEDEVVHHINKNRSDNRKSNLQLMTFKEHARLHMLERHTKRKE